MFAGVMGTIDYDRQGSQTGHLELPHSVDRSPYYRIRIPYWRMRGGQGPSVLLLGGNHGDEYDGPMAILRVMQALEPAMLNGSVTALPALNPPAVTAHARCSPLDGGNLNRSFDGHPAQGPTAQIAAHVEQVLIPDHDVIFDLHSGGTSMAHVPCALTQLLPDDSLPDRTRDLLAAMGLPYCFLVSSGRDSPTSIGAALRAGKTTISGEFGGGGATTPATMQATVNAIENVLIGLGILTQRAISTPQRARNCEFLRFNHEDLFVFAEATGWYEPLADIGDRVQAGQPALRFWNLLDPTQQPREAAFAATGVVLARRLHSHVAPGDCLFALGGPL
ncbi:MAG: succinylglutamate desuccinylase/aspartoacylase family protein [Rhodobacteraceae bacterium]|nr:succinylglutamate desuccinylase/aspartoacylase family protein [Paracoccaceae bacterium]